LDKLLEYKGNWIKHVNRMLRNRWPRLMKQYCRTDRRNHDRPLKRLLDAWDGNGSTSGQLHDRYMMMMMMMTERESRYFAVYELFTMLHCSSRFFTAD
jgi:hypothetical protein